MHLVAFFVCALVCHGELARRRPAPRYLTAFYMWMSAGGMIGGISAGLVAPYVFNWVAEYPILIVLAMLCRPGLALPKARAEQAIFFGAIAVAVIALVIIRGHADGRSTRPSTMGRRRRCWSSTVLFWRDPLPFAAIIAFVLLANHYVLDVGDVTNGAQLLRRPQDHRIVRRPLPRARRTAPRSTAPSACATPDGKPITGRPEPMMYYYDGSAMAQVLDAARARVGGPISYRRDRARHRHARLPRRAGRQLHYYEIDPDRRCASRAIRNFQLHLPNAGPTCRSCSATRA